MKSSENCSLPYTFDLKSAMAFETRWIGFTLMPAVSPLVARAREHHFNQQGAIILLNPFQEGRLTSEGRGTS